MRMFSWMDASLSAAEASWWRKLISRAMTGLNRNTMCRLSERKKRKSSCLAPAAQAGVHNMEYSVHSGFETLALSPRNTEKLKLVVDERINASLLVTYSGTWESLQVEVIASPYLSLIHILPRNMRCCTAFVIVLSRSAEPS